MEKTLRSVALLAAIAVLPVPLKAASATGDTIVPRTVVGKSGFFRVGQSSSGRWWLVDPDGRPMFHRGVCSVNRSGAIWGKPDGPYADVVKAKYGADSTVFRDSVWRRVNGWGLNVLGAWCTPEFWVDTMPFEAFLDFGMLPQKNPSGGVDVYNPAWVAAVDSIAASVCTPLKNRRMLVGYFTHNEMKLDATLGPDYYKRFLEVTSEAIRKYDPNHLNLGTRFGKPPSAGHLAVIKPGLMDVVSMNCYRFDMYSEVEQIYAATGMPVLNTEFSWGFARFADSIVPATNTAALSPEERMVVNGIATVRKAATHPAFLGYTWYRWVHDCDYNVSSVCFGLVNRAADEPNKFHIAALIQLAEATDSLPRPRPLDPTRISNRAAALSGTHAEPARSRAVDLSGRRLQTVRLPKRSVSASVSPDR